MFSTQTQYSHNRPISTSNLGSGSVTNFHSYTCNQKFTKVNSQGIQNNLKKRGISKVMAFSNNNMIQKKTMNSQKKWNKIVDLYNLGTSKHNDDEDQLKAVRPGIAFYRLLGNLEMLQKYKIRINLPETFIDQSGDFYLLKTNQTTGILECSKVQRQDYTSTVIDMLTAHSQIHQQHPTKYKDYYDMHKNVHAPVIIAKTQQEYNDKFQIQVESYKNFQERRSKPHSNRIVQRYIYCRNMKAMVMRVCYERRRNDEQREQFYAQRYQNYEDIFRVNSKNSQIYESFKNQAIISASYDRPDKIEYSRITNPKALQKFIIQSKNLINYLQQSHKIKINHISIDYIVDIYDVPWLINIKKISYQYLEKIRSFSNGLHSNIDTYGLCRICSLEYMKNQMKNGVSNRMIQDFLTHLKKRLGVGAYEGLDFLRDIGKVKGVYRTKLVCDQCYLLVAQEYKLIQQEQKLAAICNIPQPLQFHSPQVLQATASSKSDECLGKVNSQGIRIGDVKKQKQWRLMIYFSSVSNLPSNYIKKGDKLILKYRIGGEKGIQYVWPLKIKDKISTNCQGKVSLEFAVRKLKIHYFYCNEERVDKFLQDTEVSIQIATFDEKKVFAKGCSKVFTCFQGKKCSELCLRQTSSVLLFYSTGKYCEMTIKTGLICDGEYEVSDRQFIPVNNINFSQDSFMNSNPIPRQWMQAFGATTQELQNDKEIESVLTFGMGKFMNMFHDGTKKNKHIRRSLHY